MKSGPPRRFVVTGGLLVAAAAVVLASCAYPTVSVRSARLGRVKLTGLTVDVLFDVDNPNQFALPLQGVDWNLKLFDTRVGSGHSNMDDTIPAHQTTRITMPIAVRFGGVANLARRVVRSRTISWDLDGAAEFGAPTGPIELDFAEDGRWNNPLH